MARIFISYSRADRLFIEQFAPLIRRVYGNDSVWFDADIHGGVDWWQMILDEIDKCDIFVYLISNESLASPYCQAELREAIRLKKQLFPIIIRRLAPAYPGTIEPDLAHILRRIHYVDMSGDFNNAVTISELYAGLTRLLNAIPSQPVEPVTPIPTSEPPIPDKEKPLKKSGGIYLLLGLLIVGLIAVGGYILSQNTLAPETTPTTAIIAQNPTAIVTETVMITVEPTAILTDEPTVTHTPIATDIPTETLIPTQTATDIPTETWTPYPTETATDIPTATPEGELTITEALIEGKFEFVPFDECVTSLNDISSNGEYIYLLNNDNYSRHIYRASDGEILFENVSNVKFSPDSQLLYSNDKIYRLADGDILLENVSGTVNFSPNSQFISFYDLNTYRPVIYRLIDDQVLFDNVSNVVFSPDNQLVYFSDSIYRLDDGERLFDNVSNVVFSPDGQYFSFWDNFTTRFYRVIDGAEILNIEGFYSPIVIFSPDSQFIYLREFSQYKGNVYRLSDGEILFENIDNLVFSLDSQNVHLKDGIYNIDDGEKVSNLYIGSFKYIADDKQKIASLCGIVHVDINADPTILTVVSTQQFVNIRHIPNGAVMGSVSTGTQLIPIGRSFSGWYKVIYNSQQGWIAGYVVTVSGDVDSLPIID